MLWLMAQGKHDEFASRMRAQGAQRVGAAVSGWGRTLLMEAASRSGMHGFAKLLLPASDPDLADRDGMTALGYAIHRKDAQMALLLAPRADANAPDRQGLNALMKALFAGLGDEALRALAQRTDFGYRTPAGQDVFGVLELCVPRGPERIRLAGLLRSEQEKQALAAAARSHDGGGDAPQASPERKSV